MHREEVSKMETHIEGLEEQKAEAKKLVLEQKSLVKRLKEEQMSIFAAREKVESELQDLKSLREAEEGKWQKLDQKLAAAERERE